MTQEVLLVEFRIAVGRVDDRARIERRRRRLKRTQIRRRAGDIGDDI